MLEKNITEVAEGCETCAKFKKATPRPVVSLPMANKFNELIAMDLKSYGDGYFLVIVDHATSYCSAKYIRNKRPSTILHRMFLGWI